MIVHSYNRLIFTGQRTYHSQGSIETLEKFESFRF